MAVKVEDLKDGAPVEKRRRSPAMFSRGGVIGAMITILRLIAIVLVIASTFGNYVQFIGGWPTPPAPMPIEPWIIGLALLYQAVCSVLQWGFKAGGWWIPYMIALVASAIPSFLTYNAWAGPYLAAQLGPMLGGFALFLATIGADALPEWVLVE